MNLLLSLKSLRFDTCILWGKNNQHQISSIHHIYQLCVTNPEQFEKRSAPTISIASLSDMEGKKSMPAISSGLIMKRISSYKKVTSNETGKFSQRRDLNHCSAGSMKKKIIQQDIKSTIMSSRIGVQVVTAWVGFSCHTDSLCKKV